MKSNSKNNKFNWKRLLAVLFISLFAGAAVFVAAGAYIYSITPQGKTSGLYDSIKFIMKPGETAFKGKKTLNILCVGLDHNYTDQGILYTKGARTDTIFVISIDSEAKHINMLSVPRDTWIEIPGYGYSKINGAYSIGGMDLAKKTISKFLGISLDNYIIIRIKAANEIVDALGGLEIDVPKDMNYDDNWGNLHIHLKQGVQKLNGAEAAGFARFRHDEEGDWGRMKRQQQVINALLKELKKPENLLKIDKLIKIAHDNIETDMDPAEMLDICRLYKDFDRNAMRTGIVRGSDAMSDDGQAIIIPDNQEKIKLVKSLLLRDESMENTCRLSILNGSRTEGLASELAMFFEDKGYTVDNIADADSYDYEDSVIIPHTQNAQSAKQLANVLGYVTMKPKEEAAGQEEYTIIIGNKWLKWKEEHPEIFKTEPEHYEPAQTYPGVSSYPYEEPKANHGYSYDDPPQDTVRQNEIQEQPEAQQPDPAPAGQEKEPERVSETPKINTVEIPHEESSPAPAITPPPPPEPEIQEAPPTEVPTPQPDPPSEPVPLNEGMEVSE